MTFNEAHTTIKKATKNSKFTTISGLIYDLDYKIEIGESVPQDLLEAKKVLGYK